MRINLDGVTHAKAKVNVTIEVKVHSSRSARDVATAVFWTSEVRRDHFKWGGARSILILVKSHPNIFVRVWNVEPLVPLGFKILKANSNIVGERWRIGNWLSSAI